MQKNEDIVITSTFEAELPKVAEKLGVSCAYTLLLLALTIWCIDYSIDEILRLLGHTFNFPIFAAIPLAFVPKALPISFCVSLCLYIVSFFA